MTRKSLRKSPQLPIGRRRLARASSRGTLPLIFTAIAGIAPTHAGADYVPATRAFEAPTPAFACSAADLSSFARDIDLGRINPEWKAVIFDPSHPLPNDAPTLLEGFIAPTPPDQKSSDQSTVEVAEEDIPWNHYTHDFTFKVVPDPPYQYLMSSWVRFPGLTIPHFAPPYVDARFCSFLGGHIVGVDCVVAPEVCPDRTMGPTCHHTDMEVEWENASLMDEGEGFQRIWGAVPEFVWPGVGDRVWVMGRWIFDCGHPSSDDTTHVKFSTEIHPPRALVTFRLNHPALDSFPRARTSAPNFPGQQSYLPVTGEPVPGLPGPTAVAVTEADIFVSGHGGGANDVCSLSGHDIPNHGTCSNHTGPIIAVNDRNYVFDVYPPGTDFGTADPDGAEDQNHNRPFLVRRPVGDASLQWRIEDHSSELPKHACGGSSTDSCLTVGVTVDPILCLIDNGTPPPSQNETGCPSQSAQPTRLRVILPFAGTNPAANFFAKSILLGWDDVPPSAANPAVRTFRIALHQFDVKQNGESCVINPFSCDGDWRVFVSVGGQWRYLSNIFDTTASSGHGIFGLDGGGNVCHGHRLTENGDDDCFRFENTPWIVSVQDGTPIHVAVGGWESDDTDSNFCRSYPGGCDFNTGSYLTLARANNDRIGTYEFDLTWPTYNPPAPYTTQNTGDNCHLPPPFTCDELQYKVDFRVQEISAPAAATSAPLQIGDPHYNQYVSSATALVLSSSSSSARGFQYRFHRQGAPLPVYSSPLPFPVHWTRADFAPGSQSLSLHLTGVDGPYDLQFSAQTNGNVLEPRHTATVSLDNTPPVINIVQPQATPYAHSATLTLSYSVTDAGSGVKQFTPTMDGSTTLAGHGLQTGQVIHLLTELPLGTHTFSITATDNVDNTGTSSIAFTIIVTPDSIKEDVQQFLASGAIHNHGIANSLLAKLNAAANARSRGQCSTAANEYQAFINELDAQSGHHVDASAAAIMIDDARYLIAHCP